MQKEKVERGRDGKLADGAVRNRISKWMGRSSESSPVVTSDGEMLAHGRNFFAILPVRLPTLNCVRVICDRSVTLADA